MSGSKSVQHNVHATSEQGMTLKRPAPTRPGLRELLLAEAPSHALPLPARKSFGRLHGS